MGSCCGKHNLPAEISPRPSVSGSLSSVSNESPVAISCVPRLNMIDSYILQMVQMVGSMSQTFDENPTPLIKIHSFADGDEGWKRVIEGLVNIVPLDQPLGPSAITIIFDDCPLPAVSTIVKTLQSFELGRARALSCHLSDETKRDERNMLVVLGCMADKFAGQISNKLLGQDVLEYLFTYLTDHRMPELVLHAMIALEKFAKTNENKETIQDYFANQEVQHPLVPLERYCTSEDIMWRKVGFCARWLLDNVFFVDGRSLSYTNFDLSNTNAMLDNEDTTDLVKISPDGLEARCDAHTFESVCCTFKIIEGCWYYEAEILSSGVMQIGWATKQTKFNSHDGYGIGDDKFSLAYDGCRRLIWHKAVPTVCQVVDPWGPGDILGCLIDVNQQEAIFSLNGIRLPVCKDIFKNTRFSSLLFPHSSGGFYAAASLMCFQNVRFNFGNSEFRYAPVDREFMVFNDHGVLTSSKKQVLPRWLRAERQRIWEEHHYDDEQTCSICYDKKSDTILSPCRHKSFCRECALRVVECPMCRERVWHYTILPL